LSAVAFSGSYLDLINKPTIFSGNYADLVGKPIIPTVPKVSYFTATTNASGQWAITITGFATVTSVIPVAINVDNTAGGAKIATLTALSTTAASGTVVTANTILSLLGLLGLTLGAAGLTVRVRVEGT
jgi:hypothetical protein